MLEKYCFSPRKHTSTTPTAHIPRDILILRGRKIWERRRRYIRMLDGTGCRANQSSMDTSSEGISRSWNGLEEHGSGQRLTFGMERFSSSKLRRRSLTGHM